jgi:hypothetical protein
LSISDRIVGWIFSDLSLCIVLPLIFGVLIIAFPTVISDFLATIKISLPSWLWGGEEVPLQYIFTIGITQGLLSCGIPIFLGLAWSRWAGGASGFLLSVLFTLSMGVYYGMALNTVDWIGLIVSGMLAGYIAGSLMMRFRMRGSTSLKNMLIASIVPAIVAIIFTTTTYVWYSDMFAPINGSVIDGITYSYFIYTVIYGLWAILAAIVAKVASWFGIPKMPEYT